MNTIFTSKDPLTTLVTNLGIHNWNELTTYIQQLPYGRNENRTDFSLVLTEQRGTCSSKHAVLKKIAELNNFTHIKLVIGIYKMNSQNTPKIGETLKNSFLAYIPEAHCYLKIENKRFDFTNIDSIACAFEKDLLEEIEILPEQVTEFKIKKHQNFLKNWLNKQQIELDFNKLWEIREQCIQQISSSN